MTRSEPGPRPGSVDAYLERIGYEGTREPGAETLRRLHRAHMLAVPFENLDIPLGHPIVLSVPAFYEKIVRKRRGGFCYELNGSFAWLLERMGFEVRLLSARVVEGGGPGSEFDHLVLHVRTDGGWVADVGFGDSFLEPLPLDGEVHVECDRSYRLRESKAGTVLERRVPESDWEPQYVFSWTPRRLSEFDAMCHHHQTSPESSFTRKSVISRATPEGRVTLSNGRLIVTAGAGREERAVRSEEEYRALLLEHFGVVLEDGARVDRLMAPAGS